MTATRRLAAILAADAAGSPRLMGADESGTLQAFKEIQAKLLEPKIAQHHGLLVKAIGHREPLCRKDRKINSKAFAVAQG